MVIYPICHPFNAKNASLPAIGMTTNSIIGPKKRSYRLAASSTVREADRSTSLTNPDVVCLTRNAVRSTGVQYSVCSYSQVALGKVGHGIIPRDAAVVVRLGSRALIADLARWLGHERIVDIVARSRVPEQVGYYVILTTCALWTPDDAGSVPGVWPCIPRIPESYSSRQLARGIARHSCWEQCALGQDGRPAGKWLKQGGEK
jgi:hypothetical protein